MRANPFTAAFLAALALGGKPDRRQGRRRRPRLAPPTKCPAHGEPAVRNRYGKARRQCGCLWKHAHLRPAE
jgi:hypothetical protein